MDFFEGKNGKFHSVLNAVNLKCAIIRSERIPLKDCKLNLVFTMKSGYKCLILDAWKCLILDA